MKQKKCCENCIYFERHYARINGKFEPIGCGHCANSMVPPKKRRKCPHIKNCRLFID